MIFQLKKKKLPEMQHVNKKTIGKPGLMFRVNKWWQLQRETLMIVTGRGNLQIHFDKMDTRLDLQLHII